ncbi:helix-turn-helix domain-containing protein [Sphingobium sp. HBC34]|uniref:Helix-turn-helix domain-containing protein n=1 Tax=Sphingobium cyanobacteriorum TaxID=3063954 RepID=A0ABT8ZQ43_9SPHN|nr:helix-turn-helix domain-containing protein [Sphingobium sp. HBC34]MDO7836317.1 helix-turn-helix domain-containing protein [Sphingobium sp. HBC34]
MIDIAALISPGTFAASIAPLIDAFDLTQERRVRTIGPYSGKEPDVRLTLLSPDGRDVAMGRHGTLRIDQAIASGSYFNFVWIPCFRAQGESELRERLVANRAMIEWLKQAARSGSVIGASGAAVILPMAAGLTKGLQVPVSTSLLPVVRALFPRFHHGADITLADYPDLLLSRGIAQDVQAITLALSRIFSHETGRWISSVFGSETIQDDPLAESQTRDALVDKARLLLEQRFSTPVSISDLAAELCVSHSVLIRRFRRMLGMTPSHYLQHLRLGAAQRMLHHTNRSIDSVASAIGYSDARIFREMFRKATGMTATQWRHAAADRIRS